MVQLSYLYMTTGKTMTLTIWTFVSKMMSLLFHRRVGVNHALPLSGSGSCLGMNVAAESVLKSRDIILLTKVRLVKAMIFPVVTYGCESWTIKKAEH